MTARVRQEYAAEVGGETPRPLIIVRDAGEPLPAADVDALLRSALRYSARGDLDSPENIVQLEEKVEGALMGLQMSAVATGTALEVLVGMMPLTCDASCLRNICGAPEGLAANVDSAMILPTRSCLRQNARRMMKDALKQYGIGVAVQVLLAPIAWFVEAKIVDQVAQLRDATLFKYWLFEYTDLTWAEKREIASAYLARWGDAVSADAAVVSSMAREAAGAWAQDESVEQGPAEAD